MAKIDLSRQTTLAVDIDHSLIVSGIIDIVNSGIINVIQNALQIDGVPVVLTAGEMNFVQGAYDNIQDQIDNLKITVSGVGSVGDWFNAITHKSGQYVDKDTCRFVGVNIDDGFHVAGTADDLNKWLFFINGILVEIEAISSIVNSGNDILVNVNQVLGYKLKNSHHFTLWGPMK
jgi:hypothetical protein